MRRKALKKRVRSTSFFQRLATHPSEIFFVSKITSWLFYLVHTLLNLLFLIFSIYKYLMKKKVVPKLRQEVKIKVDIVTSDDIKIYYTGNFQDFTAR